MRPNFSEILNYALRCQLAYGLTQPSWDISQQIGWRTGATRSLYIDDVPSSEVNIIVELDETIPCHWIAIRGSSNLRNWLLDFDYIEHSPKDDLEEKAKGIYFHQGFYEAAQSILVIILPHLNSVNSADPLRITGHSLGGAIATILMILLQERGFFVEKTTTFGQPKVTNAKGASYYQKLPLLRVINEQDIVPSVPPNTLLTKIEGGYQHFAPEILLQSQGYLYHDQPVDHSCADSFWIHLLNASIKTDIQDLPHNIDDHYIQNYLLNLLSNLSEPNPTLQKILVTSNRL